MTKVDILLKEIETLKTSEIRLVFQKLIKKIREMEDTQKLLSQYKGIGKGVWKKDAQEIINESRADERI